MDDATVGGPDDPGRPRRLAWAELLERAWRLDALACPKCGRRMAREIFATRSAPRPTPHNQKPHFLPGSL